MDPNLQPYDVIKKRRVRSETLSRTFYKEEEKKQYLDFQMKKLFYGFKRDVHWRSTKKTCAAKKKIFFK
jgi:hypothetical protein